jgi:phosphoribosyl 1,2-cyclic phosphate phosphodiesterase
MKMTFLGTGTSIGVPVIGCACAVCRSPDPKNRRRRSSVHVEAEGLHIQIDTPPDFRDQVLDHGVKRVDVLLITHAHADHIFGFDDLRSFNTIKGGVIPVYGSSITLDEMRRLFPYALRPAPDGMFRPQVTLNDVSEPFDIGPVRATPVPVHHGGVDMIGYRLDAGGRSLGYVPDCLSMTADAVAAFVGVQVMVLDALRHRPHASHSHVKSSLAMLARIGAERSYLTHMCHDIDHEAVQAILPPEVMLAWDGLVVDV